MTTLLPTNRPTLPEANLNALAEQHDIPLVRLKAVWIRGEDLDRVHRFIAVWTGESAGETNPDIDLLPEDHPLRAGDLLENAAAQDWEPSAEGPKTTSELQSLIDNLTLETANRDIRPLASRFLLYNPDCWAEDIEAMQVTLPSETTLRLLRSLRASISIWQDVSLDLKHISSLIIELDSFLSIPISMAAPEKNWENQATDGIARYSETETDLLNTRIKLLVWAKPEGNGRYHYFGEWRTATIRRKVPQLRDHPQFAFASAYRQAETYLQDEFRYSNRLSLR